MSTVVIRGVSVSRQALGIACGGAALALAVLLFSPFDMEFRFAMFVSILLTSFVSAYNANCAVVGNCQVWAWALATIFTLKIISGGMIMFTSPKKHMKLARRNR